MYELASDTSPEELEAMRCCGRQLYDRRNFACHSASNSSVGEHLPFDPVRDGSSNPLWHRAKSTIDSQAFEMVGDEDYPTAEMSPIGLASIGDNGIGVLPPIQGQPELLQYHHGNQDLRHFQDDDGISESMPATHALGMRVDEEGKRRESRAHQQPNRQQFADALNHDGEEMMTVEGDYGAYRLPPYDASVNVPGILDAAVESMLFDNETKPYSNDGQPLLVLVNTLSSAFFS